MINFIPFRLLHSFCYPVAKIWCYIDSWFIYTKSLIWLKTDDYRSILLYFFHHIIFIWHPISTTNIFSSCSFIKFQYIITAFKFLMTCVFWWFFFISSTFIIYKMIFLSKFFYKIRISSITFLVLYWTIKNLLYW